MSDDAEHGPPLCVAIHGDYMCEKSKGHDGPHIALKGEIEWDGSNDPRSLRTEDDR